MRLVIFSLLLLISITVNLQAYDYNNELEVGSNLPVFHYDFETVGVLNELNLTYTGYTTDTDFQIIVEAIDENGNVISILYETNIINTPFEDYDLIYEFEAGADYIYRVVFYYTDTPTLPKVLYTGIVKPITEILETDSFYDDRAPTLVQGFGIVFDETYYNYSSDFLHNNFDYNIINDNQIFLIHFNLTGLTGSQYADIRFYNELTEEVVLTLDTDDLFTNLYGVMGAEAGAFKRGFLPIYFGELPQWYEFAINFYNSNNWLYGDNPFNGSFDYGVYTADIFRSGSPTPLQCYSDNILIISEYENPFNYNSNRNDYLEGQNIIWELNIIDSTIDSLFYISFFNDFYKGIDFQNQIIGNSLVYEVEHIVNNPFFNGVIIGNDIQSYSNQAPIGVYTLYTTHSYNIVETFGIEGSIKVFLENIGFGGDAGYLFAFTLITISLLIYLKIRYNLTDMILIIVFSVLLAIGGFLNIIPLWLLVVTIIILLTVYITIFDGGLK